MREREFEGKPHQAIATKATTIVILHNVQLNVYKIIFITVNIIQINEENNLIHTSNITEWEVVVGWARVEFQNSKSKNLLTPCRRKTQK